MIRVSQIRLAGMILVTALTLGGCGFTPMYAASDAPGDVAVTNAMAAIRIHPIADHDGVKLRQVLREGLEPDGAATNLQYDLEIQMVSVTQELGIQKDATSTRANRIYTAKFALSQKGRRVLGDQVQSVVSYDIANDQYATVAAINDASDRAIKQIGDEIRTRIAIYLRSHTEVAASH